MYNGIDDRTGESNDSSTSVSRKNEDVKAIRGDSPSGDDLDRFDFITVQTETLQGYINM